MDFEKREELMRLFEKYENLLTTAQKQYLKLYLFEDLGISEIANEVATTRQAVHDAINKATKKLYEIASKIE